MATKAAPLDHTKELGPDKQDPRSGPKSWPCYGQHVSLERGSNGFAQWRHCKTCGLRVTYIPRVGYQAKYQHLDYQLMGQVMDQLKKHLEPLDRKPTRAMVELMQDLLMSKNRIRNHELQLKALQDHCVMLQNKFEGLLNVKTSPSNETHRQRDIDVVWETLSPQEKTDLLKLAQARTTVVEIPDNDVELVEAVKTERP